MEGIVSMNVKRFLMFSVNVKVKDMRYDQSDQGASCEVKVNKLKRTDFKYQSLA